jgi:hypothetical protein
MYVELVLLDNLEHAYFAAFGEFPCTTDSWG